MTIPVYGVTSSGKPIPASYRAPVVDTFTRTDICEALDRLEAKLWALVAYDVLLDAGPREGGETWTHNRIVRDVCALEGQIEGYSSLLWDVWD